MSSRDLPSPSALIRGNATSNDNETTPSNERYIADLLSFFCNPQQRKALHDRLQLLPPASMFSDFDLLLKLPLQPLEAANELKKTLKMTAEGGTVASIPPMAQYRAATPIPLEPSSKSAAGSDTLPSPLMSASDRIRFSFKQSAVSLPPDCPIPSNFHARLDPFAAASDSLIPPYRMPSSTTAFLSLPFLHSLLSPLPLSSSTPSLCSSTTYRCISMCFGVQCVAPLLPTHCVPWRCHFTAVSVRPAGVGVLGRLGCLNAAA